MENFFEKLKAYFEETEQEKILEDWSKSEEFDNVGLTVDDFLMYNQKQYYVFHRPPDDQSDKLIYNFSPKFSSGFLIK